jgi:enoyl-CoA hydratase/carnithine racemase
MSDSPLVQEIADGIATLTLNRPDAMNAINQAMKDALAAALTCIVADPTVRVVVLTGAGERAFCSGADIKERSSSELSPAQFLLRQQATHQLFDRLEQLPQPVIAAINGVAYGGGAEIALCADLRLMADTALIGLTEVNLGVIPAGGGTQRLPHLIGIARTKELIFTGRRLTAAEALAMGLVNAVVPAAELPQRARELAGAIAAKPPLAVRYAKQVIDAGFAGGREAGMRLECQAAAILFDTDDRREGMRAFVEKRAPVFRGS